MLQDLSDIAASFEDGLITSTEFYQKVIHCLLQKEPTKEEAIELAAALSGLGVQP